MLRNTYLRTTELHVYMKIIYVVALNEYFVSSSMQDT